MRYSNPVTSSILVTFVGNTSLDRSTRKKMCTKPQINNYFEFAVGLVKICGKLIREAKNITFETKKEEWDIVTQYDRSVEEELIKKIKEKFPDHKFISEEDCSDTGKIPELTDEPTWIIDPIDGTANFVRNFPITCISVGFVINKVQTIGIIYNPFLNELYTAIKGEGAFLNGKRIYTSKQKDIGCSLFNYELSLARSEEYRDLYLYRLKHIIGVIQGIRSLGCAALGLCYVASGIMDAYQCDGLYPWDAAAGALIVEEAGGYVRSSTGGAFDLMKPSFIAASTKVLGEQYIALERKADEERMNNCHQTTKRY